MPSKSAKAKAPAPRKLPVFWLAMAGVAVVAVIVIVISLSGSDSKRGKNAGGANGTALQQTQPVQVTGQPLPNMPESGADTAVGTPVPTVSGKSFDGTPIT